jgi:putative solute:sodium symporter small subunit
VSPQPPDRGDSERLQPAVPPVPGGVEPRSPREEHAESTAHGQVYLQRLRRAQLGLSLTSLMAFAAIFGVMPIALFLLPHLDRITLLTIPLPLWIIVVPMLPVFVAIGWLYTRRANEIDDGFRDLVER